MAYLASQLFAGTSCEYGLSLLRTHAHSPVVASTLTAHCHIDYFTSLPSLACGLVFPAPQASLASSAATTAATANSAAGSRSSSWDCKDNCQCIKTVSDHRLLRANSMEAAWCRKIFRLLRCGNIKTRLAPRISDESKSTQSAHLCDGSPRDPSQGSPHSSCCWRNFETIAQDVLQNFHTATCR